MSIGIVLYNIVYRIFYLYVRVLMVGKGKSKKRLTEQEHAILKIFAADLAAERNAQDKTQMEMAISMNTHTYYLSRVEGGTMEPGLIKFLYLAAALGKTPQELLKNTWPAFLEHYNKMQSKG